MTVSDQAVHLRGWDIVANAGEAVQRILGADPDFKTLPSEDGGWHNAYPVGPAEPIGVPEALVSFSADRPAAVEILLGSQGVAQPQQDAGVGALRLEVGPERTLLLDGRCWYRVLGPAVKAVFWKHNPGFR